MKSFNAHNNYYPHFKEAKTETQKVTSPESPNPEWSQDLEPSLCDFSVIGLPLSAPASMEGTEDRDLETSQNICSSGPWLNLCREASSEVLSVLEVMTPLGISQHGIPFS